MQACAVETERHFKAMFDCPRSYRSSNADMVTMNLEREQAREDEHPAEERTTTTVLVEFCGVALFFGQAAITAKKMYDRLVADDLSSSTILQIRIYTTVSLFIGILAADVVSGVVHWAADNWGRSSWPGIGHAFIQPFRYHHIDPRSITRHGFLELNGNNFIVSLPSFWVASSALKLEDSASALAAATFWVSFALFCGFTNQFHCWAHMENPPVLVKSFQDAGLLMSRQHHHLHHIRPHDCYYCITTGWMNRPLAAFGFFEGLETAITAITGAVPLHQQVQKT
ncbi:Kua-ubiquitin conjugating enzyme hybrid localization domain-containing protein [Trichoderma barbatum]